VIRNQLEKDLHNRIDKVIKLELQLEEVKDAYKSLEHSISRDDLKFKQKAQNLEKNLEQIHQMYQNVTSEKSILKVDLQVAERKLSRKEEKIQQLEKSFMASR
jgi:kinesin family protein 5